MCARPAVIHGEAPPEPHLLLEPCVSAKRQQRAVAPSRAGARGPRRVVRRTAAPRGRSCVPARASTQILVSRAIACAAACSVGCWPAVLRLHVRQQQQQQEQQEQQQMMQQPPRPPPSCRSTGRTRRSRRPALAARTSTTSTTRWKRRSSWRQWRSRRTARARTPAGALSLQGRRYDYIQSCVHDHHDCVLSCTLLLRSTELLS